MTDLLRYSISEEERKKYITALQDELPTLRAKASISQDELSNAIGVSRQTYGSMERRSRNVSWSTYLALILFFDFNKDTHDFLRTSPAFPGAIFDRINQTDSSFDLISTEFLEKQNKNILNVLDGQALKAIKTIIMVEYARCSSMSPDAMMKFFSGYLESTGNDK